MKFQFSFLFLFSSEITFKSLHNLRNFVTSVTSLRSLYFLFDSISMLRWANGYTSPVKVKCILDVTYGSPDITSKRIPLVGKWRLAVLTLYVAASVFRPNGKCYPQHRGNRGTWAALPRPRISRPESPFVMASLF